MNDWYLGMFIQLGNFARIGSYVHFFLGPVIFVTNERVSNSYYCQQTEAKSFKPVGLTISDKD